MRHLSKPVHHHRLYAGVSIRFAFSLVFAALIICALPKASFAQKQDALKRARQGYDFEHQGKLQEALYEYNAAIAIDPNYPCPLTRIGAMYQTLRNYPLAIQYYNRAVKIDSSYDVYSYYNLGLSYRVVRKFDTAVIAFKEFLR